jgi:hypothetical protein
MDWKFKEKGQHIVKEGYPTILSRLGLVKWKAQEEGIAPKNLATSNICRQRIIKLCLK